MKQQRERAISNVPWPGTWKHTGKGWYEWKPVEPIAPDNPKKLTRTVRADSLDRQMELERTLPKTWVWWEWL